MSEADLLTKWDLLDKAAKKPDRWWFFALLIFVIVAGGWLYRDLRSERQAQDLKIDAMHQRIEGLLSLTVGDTTRALERNTTAFEANTAMLRRVDERLQKQAP